MLYGYLRCVVFTLIVLHTFFDCFVAVLFCLVDSVLLALVGCFGLCGWVVYLVIVCFCYY